jgi:Zn-dependent M28 family amino/carboxypeptidase
MRGFALALCLSACGLSVRGGPPIEHPPVREVPLLDEQCGTSTPSALRLCIDAKQLRRDIEAIALPRPPSSPQHEAVRRLCAERFASLGFDVEVFDYGGGVNVIATKHGLGLRHEHVVLAAHYDGIPGCPGADDNASGVAGVLEAARILSTARFDRTLIAACWDGFEPQRDEPGARGSSAFAQRIAERDERVVMAFEMEAIGYSAREPNTQRVPDGFDQWFPDKALALLDNDYRGDFLLVLSDDPSKHAAKAIARHGERVGLPVEVLELTARHKHERQGLHRRDQASFWDRQIAAVLLTDSGHFRNPRVGCQRGSDTADKLDYAFATRVVQAAIGAVAEELRLR